MLQLEAEKCQLSNELQTLQKSSASQAGELHQNLATLQNRVVALEQALQNAQANENRLDNKNETLRKQMDNIRQQMVISERNAQQLLEQEMARVREEWFALLIIRLIINYCQCSLKLNNEWQAKLDSTIYENDKHLAEVNARLQQERDDVLSNQKQLLTNKFEEERAQLKQILQDEANQASELQTQAEQQIQQLVVEIQSLKSRQREEVHLGYPSTPCIVEMLSNRLRLRLP